MKTLRKLQPGVLLVLGFASVILLGAFFLMLPIARRPGVSVHFVDALFTSTSAVCVTGLATVDPGDTFSVWGCTAMALLIQIGGLGVSSVGVGLILLARGRVGLKSRLLVKEAMNLDSFRGIVNLVRSVLCMTLMFEGIGALLSFFSFSRSYPPLQAMGISVFHAVSAFNNAGFDILGGFTNLIPYQKDVLLNLTTAGLIFFGGIGYLTVLGIVQKHAFRKLSLHSKIVLTTSVALVLLGTLLLKATEQITWLGAFFQSVSTRTAGFSTYPIGSFTDAGLFLMIMLMFIGASPGSNGGGIKTSTFFILLLAVRSAATGRATNAFKRSVTGEIVRKAFVITLLSALVVLTTTFFLCLLEPEYEFIQNFFEVTSAFGTVGLSTGITPALHPVAKLLLTGVMFIGRLGPLTIASLWAFKTENSIRYTEESVAIG